MAKPALRDELPDFDPDTAQAVTVRPEGGSRVIPVTRSLPKDWQIVEIRHCLGRTNEGNEVVYLRVERLR